jgi:hypothetical protein
MSTGFNLISRKSVRNDVNSRVRKIKEDHWEETKNGAGPITNSMEQNPSSEADSRSDDQEISRPLWKQRNHYRVKKNTPWSLYLVNRLRYILFL